VTFRCGFNDIGRYRQSLVYAIYYRISQFCHYFQYFWFPIVQSQGANLAIVYSETSVHTGAFCTYRIYQGHITVLSHLVTIGAIYTHRCLPMQSVMPKLILAHLGLASPQSQQISLPEIFNNCSHTLKFR